MKRLFTFLFLALFSSIIFTVVKNSTLFYPPFPMNSVSHQEALEKLEQSTNKIIKVGEEENYAWYFTSFDQGKAYERFKKEMLQNGWVFQQKEGATYSFVKNGEVRVGTCRMWTGKYVICKVPIR